jgi:dienelactone hydrolase
MTRRSVVNALVLGSFSAAIAVAVALHAQAAERVLPEGKIPEDKRLAKPRDLNSEHCLVPYSDKAEWLKRRQFLREQILLAAGLWPMPEKTPLKAVVHGAVDRGNYTVERVYFQSHPGFYCTGSLYRPKGKGPFPGILNPHGHWSNGRFYDNEKGAAAELKSGRETDPLAARYPLQARNANLAEQGYIVFHYDMIGYADSYQLSHRGGNNTPNELGGPEMTLWGHNVFGLQTWNSIRSLDFLLSLPDVDPKRIGCTGASGGGTQTFILSAIDDRIAVSVPAVMVSTTMQGGCQCENSHHLRFETDNVEIAAMFAPKPQLLINCDGDWTKKIPEVGFPQIKATYALLGAENNVESVIYKAPHNYNKNSREAMYAFFGKHLLGTADASKLKEGPFVPLNPAKELSVWTADHPKPADALTAEGLKKYLIAQGKKVWESYLPRDAAGLKYYRDTVGVGLRHVLQTQMPAPTGVEIIPVRKSAGEGHWTALALLSRKGAGEQVPGEAIFPTNGNGEAVLVVTPEGRAGVPAEFRELWKRGYTVAMIDPFLTGEWHGAKPTPEHDHNRAFFPGYNRTTVGNRVHDILTAVAALKANPGVKIVHLVGLGEAGIWCTMARGLAGDAIGRTAVDNMNFHFSSGKIMLPNAMMLGGMRHMTPLAAPGELLVYNTQGTFTPDVLEAVYKLSGGEGKWRVEKDVVPTAKIIEWITRK